MSIEDFENEIKNAIVTIEIDDVGPETYRQLVRDFPNIEFSHNEYSPVDRRLIRARAFAGNIRLLKAFLISDKVSQYIIRTVKEEFALKPEDLIIASPYDRYE